MTLRAVASLGAPRLTVAGGSEPLAGGGIPPFEALTKCTFAHGKQLAHGRTTGEDTARMQRAQADQECTGDGLRERSGPVSSGMHSPYPDIGERTGSSAARNECRAAGPVSLCDNPGPPII